MKAIETIDALEALYGVSKPEATDKVVASLTPHYRAWIDAARFCVLSTVGPEGTDASPRGEDGPVVRQHDARTLLLPDWRGNNRIDSLRNIVRDPRVSLMFMVPGSSNVVRVNGRAIVTDEAELLGSFARKGHLPRSVIAVTTEEIYFQCARAILRSGLWDGQDRSGELPTAGDFLAEISDGQLGGARYDADWPDRARRTLW